MGVARLTLRAQFHDNYYLAIIYDRSSTSQILFVFAILFYWNILFI